MLPPYENARRARRELRCLFAAGHIFHAPCDAAVLRERADEIRCRRAQRAAACAHIRRKTANDSTPESKRVRHDPRSREKTAPNILRCAFSLRQRQDSSAADTATLLPRCGALVSVKMADDARCAVRQRRCDVYAQWKEWRARGAQRRCLMACYARRRAGARGKASAQAT